MTWKRRSFALSFSVSATLTLALLAFRLLVLERYLPHLPGVQIFGLAALLGAALGGLAAGAASTVFAVVVSHFFVVPPRFSFGVKRTEDLIVLVFLAAVGLLASVLFEALHLKSERIERLASELTARVTDLEALQEVFPAPVFFGNADCSVITANRFGYELFGMPEGSNVSSTAARVPFRVERDGAPIPGPELPMQKAAATGEPVWGYEHDVVFEDGRRVTLHANVRPLFDANGKVRGVIGAYADITARKRAEEERRRSEERLSRALSASRMSVVEWDLATGVVMRSPNVEEIFGVPLPVRGPVEEAFHRMHPDDAPRAREAIRNAIESGGSVRVDYRFLRPDGTTKWAEFRGEVHRDADGRPVRVSAAIVDISERKAFEEALSAADRRKDEFLAVLAHELRNPLAPIRSGLEVLRRAPGEGHRAAALSVLERQVTHLVRLVNDLLDTARIQTGKLAIEKQPGDLSEIVAHAVSSVAPLAAARRVALEWTPARGALPVTGDHARLTQVALNVLDNALKFTPEGGRIRVATAAEEGRALLTVRDDGVGIPAEKLDSIFESFVQVDGAIDRAFGGLGLGLSLVRSLVELHGGTVAAASDGPGKGSTFSVRLPLSEAAAVAPPAPEPPAAAATPLSILVVDDSHDACDSLAMFLRLLGHEVVTAHDGPTALAMIARQPPAVVLCDVAMPGMTGLDVARAIRERCGAAAPLLVALTGYGANRDRESTRAAGFDEHLVKPVDARAIELFLERVAADRARGAVPFS